MPRVHRLVQLLRTALRLARRVPPVLRDRGPRYVAVAAIDRVRGRLAGPGYTPPPARQKIRMLVSTTTRSRSTGRPAPHWAAEPHVVTDRPLRTAWIMHPPGESSGGAQNIFRFIQYLERAGHRGDDLPVPLVRPRGGRPVPRGRSSRRAPRTPTIDARFLLYTGAVAPGDATRIFATGWETAYPAYRDPSPARRFYFVQDFEPAFYPVGSEHVFAENTYRFGFHGITAGRLAVGQAVHRVRHARRGLRVRGRRAPLLLHERRRGATSCSSTPAR